MLTSGAASPLGFWNLFFMACDASLLSLPYCHDSLSLTGSEATCPFLGTKEKNKCSCSTSKLPFWKYQEGHSLWEEAWRKSARREGKRRRNLEAPAPPRHDIVDFDSVCLGLVHFFIDNERLHCILKRARGLDLANFRNFYWCRAEQIRENTLESMMSYWRSDT